MLHLQPTRIEHEPEPKIAGTRLLLVEDNTDARMMLEKSLRHKGFEVATAGDGVTGLEACCELESDVAILDLGLPRTDG